ncbi:MAG: ABC transporter permease [Euryarchaeota archaeon]|nr:ABC transporter permease [Euryarchaeota archaeon]
MFSYLKQLDLIRTLTAFEIKLRYRGSLLGIGWSLISPLLLALVLYAVFKNAFRFEMDNFAFYLLIGIFVFRFLSVGTSVGMRSIIDKAHIVTKTPIPREILTITTTLSYFISSFVELLILVLILAFFGVGIGSAILLLPVCHIVYFILVYGINLFLSAFMVYYRDLTQIWEVFLNVLFFASPIVYPISIIPANIIPIYMLNPITRLIVMYRSVMLYNRLPNAIDFCYVFIFSCLVLLAGHLFFQKLQSRFAEVI